MLAATRTARQLFQSLFSARRMGNPASNIVSPQAALPGRKEAIAVAGMGCFWGAERKFWTLKGVYSTQVGYAGGYTPNPTYEEVCSGRTGHAEVVRVVYQPERISFEELLKVFWENHDPTQGLRQGNDHGSQYRSAIYPTSAEHMEASLRSKDDYQKASHCVASSVAEHRLWTRRLSGHGSRAQPLCGMWDPPRPWHEPASPASAGGLPTTAPSGKPEI
ncbi:mitochondrial peptide methionine sulfoxide reductase isoform X4 [Mesoplodon densirostris]|uniref:mitochondrial peptide methionine sulfoxide reductase isoform X4 n=1 Tax=Mesoplodon densirostris TaxID=48708 RepID=UPI0028DCEB95|nr:mitochondrial peptide methionine sulfoxide reductase isoform X4 [Mesoplodon densirostris]